MGNYNPTVRFVTNTTVTVWTIIGFFLMCYLFETNSCVLCMCGASCRAGLIQREASGDNNEECSDWARKSTQHDLMYGFPARLCLPAHIFLDKISTPSLAPVPRPKVWEVTGRKCYFIWVSLRVGRQLQLLSALCTNGDEILVFHSCLCYFVFAILIHWLKLARTVHSRFPVWATGWSFPFSLEGGMIFLLDVCHVDKSVAGMEYMNNPWSKDVYSAAWSWGAIIQLQLFCHRPADFFLFVF